MKVRLLITFVTVCMFLALAATALANWRNG